MKRTDELLEALGGTETSRTGANDEDVDIAGVRLGDRHEKVARSRILTCSCQP